MGGPAERARAGSVKATGVEKLRQATSSEGRQRAIRISGFSSIKGMSGVDGVYAQNSPEAFYKVCWGFTRDQLWITFFLFQFIFTVRRSIPYVIFLVARLGGSCEPAHNVVANRDAHSVVCGCVFLMFASQCLSI